MAKIRTPTHYEDSVRLEPNISQYDITGDLVQCAAYPVCTSGDSRTEKRTHGRILRGSENGSQVGFDDFPITTLEINQGALPRDCDIIYTQSFPEYYRYCMIRMTDVFGLTGAWIVSSTGVKLKTLNIGQWEYFEFNNYAFCYKGEGFGAKLYQYELKYYYAYWD